MVESLSEFIARRRQEISAAEEALKEQLHELLEERLRLARAENAIAGTSNQDHCAVRQTKERRQPRGIIKRAILKTLEDAPEGMDALTILFTINYRLGSNFARTSLSPQLSRLKEDGFVILTRKIWKLAPNGDEEIRPARSELPIFRETLKNDEGQNAFASGPS
jgi:DNA-binding PadR family transcriptional regulator